jgi:chromosome segregation protein
MGDVNLGAIESFQRLSERYNELSYQKEDILGSKKKIEVSIKELDLVAQKKFQEALEELKVAFSDCVKLLFGDGEGILRLSDPENVMSSGIEIEITLPGKKRQRLELLSGGERALCACAFLFGLLRVKPSPLVVLDEVDAPLDGANVERFIRLVRDFGRDTQFLIITHNPVTIESASSWFGVTMQEPGVSTLVPYRVPVPLA